jgi:hypothetical protein
MNIEGRIPLIEISTHYNVQISFINNLVSIGLIQIDTIEEVHYIHEDQLRLIEKIIRLHNELDVNIEGIDIVFNLLEKIDALQEELKVSKSRLDIYEK